MRKTPLSIRCYSLAWASNCALAIIVVSLAGLAGVATEFIDLLSDALVGYELTFAGVVVGIVWAFLLGMVWGGVFAWLYNKMV